MYYKISRVKNAFDEDDSGLTPSELYEIFERRRELLVEDMDAALASGDEWRIVKVREKLQENTEIRMRLLAKMGDDSGNNGAEGSAKPK